MKSEFKMFMNRFSKEFAAIIVIYIAVSALSIYLHIPRESAFLNNPGLSYSDIVYGLYNPIFLDIVSPSGLIDMAKVSEKWFNRDTAITFTRTRICPIPYIDYKFEYPPIVGALWFISTCISFIITFPQSYTPSDYYRLAKSAGEIHYYIQSLFTAIAFTILSIYMYRIAKALKITWKRVALFAILPSTVLYLIYNWDIVTAMFFLMSLYYLTNRKYFVSGVLLGLSISTKLLPLLFAAFIVYDLIQKSYINKDYTSILKKFSVALVLTGLIPYIIVLLLSYEGFTYFIQHHYQWYCENCIYLIITKDIWSPLNRWLSMFFVLVFALITMVIDINYNSAKQLSLLSLVSLIMATALNYVFSPQMMLLITPIAFITLSLRQLIFLVIADAANFGIMALFFKDAEVRSWLTQNLGYRIPITFSPWTLDSPVQLLATVRNIILILIMIELVYNMLRTRIE